MAPVAGRLYARARRRRRRRHRRRHRRHHLRRQPRPRAAASRWTRETWLGQPFVGHMTGFPSVDVESIGAGGGSIAWVDDGGLLHVGPQSAGADPGPGLLRPRRRREPTVTDAALVLGYIDPGLLPRRRDAARPRGAAQRRSSATSPSRSACRVDEAAAAILALATEQHGAGDRGHHDQPGHRSAAARCWSAAAARRASTRSRSPAGSAARAVLIPETGAALSAAGALMSDLAAEHRPDAVHATATASTSRAVNAVSPSSRSAAAPSSRGPATGRVEQRIEFSVEARYPHQVWEIEVPLRAEPLAEGRRRRARWSRTSTRTHQEIFAISDPRSEIERGDVARAGPLPPARARAGGSPRAPAPRAARRPPAAGLFPGSGLGRGEVVRVRGAGRRRRRVAGPGHRRVAVHHRRRRSGRGRDADGAAAASRSIRPPSARSPSMTDRASAAATACDDRLAVLASRLRGHRAARWPTRCSAPAARACSTSRATSPACSSPPTTSCSRRAESLPIHVMSGPDLIAAYDEGVAPGAAARRRLPAQLALSRQLARGRPLPSSCRSSTTTAAPLHRARQGAPGRLRQLAARPPTWATRATSTRRAR